MYNLGLEARVFLFDLEADTPVVALKHGADLGLSPHQTRAIVKQLKNAGRIFEDGKRIRLVPRDQTVDGMILEEMVRTRTLLQVLLKGQNSPLKKEGA